MSLQIYKDIFLKMKTCYFKFLRIYMYPTKTFYRTSTECYRIYQNILSIILLKINSIAFLSRISIKKCPKTLLNSILKFNEYSIDFLQNFYRISLDFSKKIQQDIFAGPTPSKVAGLSPCSLLSHVPTNIRTSLRRRKDVIFSSFTSRSGHSSNY